MSDFEAKATEIIEKMQVAFDSQEEKVKEMQVQLEAMREYLNKSQKELNNQMITLAAKAEALKIMKESLTDGEKLEVVSGGGSPNTEHVNKHRKRDNGGSVPEAVAGNAERK